MTEKQRGIYMMFCMAGRIEEALEYKAKCEAKEAAKSAPSPDGPEEEDAK